MYTYLHINTVDNGHFTEEAEHHDQPVELVKARLLADVLTEEPA